MNRLLLQLRWLYWKWALIHARDFRINLENTISSERERARDAVEHAELMERRAELALIAARIDDERARA